MNINTPAGPFTSQKIYRVLKRKPNSNTCFTMKFHKPDHAAVGETYFGCRHGLETLSQLISYDELTDSLQMHSNGLVEDAPAYIHRGLLIDTSRNYFNLDILKGIVDALSYNKMNVFHWHITDTHSFPLHLKSVSP